jgi:hypothetical protein
MATTSTDHWLFSDPMAAVQSAVFERAISHYCAVLATTGLGIGRFGRPELVPRVERRRFFEHMHADFVRYEPRGYRPPPVPAAPSSGSSSRARTR